MPLNSFDIKRFILLSGLVFSFMACDNQKYETSLDNLEEIPSNFVVLGEHYAEISTANIFQLGGPGTICFGLEKRYDQIAIFYIFNTPGPIPSGTYDLNKLPHLFDIALTIDGTDYSSLSGKLVINKQDSIATIFSEDLIMEKLIQMLKDLILLGFIIMGL